MNRKLAEELITRYINAWVNKDFETFKQVVHHQACVRECTGAVITSKAELHRWFTEWNRSDNQVVYWHIHYIGYDEGGNKAFVEWSFKCIYESHHYEWDGASIVSFRDALISELNEYEMKQKKLFPYRDG